MRGLVALIACLALAVAGLLAIATNLAHPWVKPHVVRVVQESAGYEIDYADAKLRGRTLTLDGLVVRGAKPLRSLAPALLRAERVRAELALRAPQLRALRVERPTLVVLIDEHGRTSFDTPAGPASGEPATPPSQRAAAILGKPLPLRRAVVTALTLTYLQSERGRIVEQDTLRGVSLAVDTEPVDTGTRVIVTSKGPFELTRASRQARGTLGLTLRADARDADVALRVAVAQQDIVPALAVRELAQVEAQAAFGNGETRLALRTFALADGAASGTAALSLPDRGAPRVHEAHGELDASRVAQLASPWTDIAVQAGKLRYRIADVMLDRPATQARLAIEGEVEGVRARGVALGRAQVDVEGQPSAAGLQLRGRAVIDRLSAQGLELEALSLRLRGSQDRAGAIAGEANAHFASLQHSVRVQDGAVVLRVRGLDPVALTGDAHVDAKLAAVEASDLSATGVHIRAHAPLEKGVYTLDGTLEVDSLRTPQLELPVHADYELAGTDAEHVRGNVELKAGSLSASVHATRRVDSMDYELTVSAPDLGLLRPWLTPDFTQRMPLAEMATTLHSRGRVSRLRGEPRLEQRSELRMQHAALGDVRTRALELDLRGSGDRLRHRLRAELRVQGLQYAGRERERDRIELALAFDRVKPALELDLKTDAQAALKAKLAVTGGALDYDVRGRIADLSPFAGVLAQSRALAGFDVSELDVELASRGRLLGVVRGASLTEDPLMTVAGEGTVAIHAQNFRWAQGELAVSVPSASWNATLRGDGTRRAIDSELRAGALEGAWGSQRIAIADLHDHTAVTLTGGLRDGVVEHDQRVTIRGLQQQIAGGYAVGDVEGSVRARREPDGLIKLHELRIDNRAGGTRLSLSGGLQLTRDEQRLSLRSVLEQDLARLPAFFEGQGKLALEVALSSSDFRLFHAAAKLQLAGASVRVPKAKIALESIDGDLPVVSDFIVDRDGIELLRGARINPYATQRFADQHPALGYRSFMSIARVQTPWFSFAPFAANLEVVRNIVSLSQVELGARRGTITGSGMLEYDGLDSRLDANLRASGVESSHGEPFDGNAALTIGIRERSIEGRADILRIGRRHLTDLLDLQDPLHADPSFNAIRRALRFGYPDRVRLSFQHGFANAGVEFGGLARLVKLNDIRGIPIGPLVERIMTSFEPERATP